MMKYYEIPEDKKNQFLAWWNHENEAPLLCIQARKTLPRVPCIPVFPRDLTERWENEKFLNKLQKFTSANTYYGGASVPVYNPNLGPDILGACTGYADIEYGKNTSWAHPKVTDWDEISEIKLDENNPWWKKILSITESAARENGGKYIVGMTDLHPGTDGLVSIRGAENLCYDLIDCPELVEKALAQITDFYKDIFTRLAKVIGSDKCGYTTWNNVWSDTPYNIVSSDFSALIGPDDYERFVAPHIEAEVDFLDRSIYHLDGPDALRHLDRILAMKKLDGVQWVPGAGRPPMREWIPVLKKIQDAGKLIEITVEAADVKPLCDNLDPRGLCLRVYGWSKREAKSLEKLVSGYQAAKKFY